MVCHGVYDEAGDTGSHAASSHYLIGAAVLCDSLQIMERVAWAVRKDARKRHIRQPELKARLVPPGLIVEGLRHALQSDWQAIVIVVDKHKNQTMLEDREEIYRWLTARVVLRCVQRNPNLHLVADKRYTNSSQRDRLVDTIHTAIAAAGINAVLTVEQVSSEQRQELLLADYLAWVLFQKYERGDLAGYALVQERIIVEEVISSSLLLSAAGHEKTAWHPGG